MTNRPEERHDFVECYWTVYLEGEGMVVMPPVSNTGCPQGPGSTPALSAAEGDLD